MPIYAEDQYLDKLESYREQFFSNQENVDSTEALWV